MKILLLFVIVLCANFCYAEDVDTVKCKMICSNPDGSAHCVCGYSLNCEKWEKRKFYTTKWEYIDNEIIFHAELSDWSKYKKHFEKKPKPIYPTGDTVGWLYPMK